MYYERVQPLAQTVLLFIRKHALLMPGDRVGAAVSGGADSIALLRLLMELRRELGIVLSVVHFNHRLRGPDSENDERFVAGLAQQHKLDLHCASGNVAEHAAQHHLGLETAARELRYQYFRELLLKKDLNRIATAHTLDDQAETVLLRLVRGAGSRGLAGIYPQLSVASSRFSEVKQLTASAIVRPLLSVRRKDLEAYLGRIGQTWREDLSNQDLKHARNRVRHEILPRMERDLNPAVQQVLAETAEIARGEEQYWEDQTQKIFAAAWHGGAQHGALRINIANLSLAVRRRLVRAAAESLGLRLEFRHVEEILGVAAKQTKSAELPNGWTVSVHAGELRFVNKTVSPTLSDYEFSLSLPGAIEVPQLGSRFEAILVSGNRPEAYNREHLLDRLRLGGELRVRNWRPGDRFWPAHTKTPKKIKELLRELHLTGPDRKLWPVVASGTDVIWLRGFPAPIEFRLQGGSGEAVLIRETGLQSGK